MNKKLVFSWGHILALLACIVLSCTAFVGLCYYTRGNFLLSGLLVALMDLSMIFFFIGAQQLKIWDGDFKKYIIVERWFLLFFAPLSLLVAMYPVNHILSLSEKQDAIVTQFTCAVDTSKLLFDDYEAFAKKRIQALEKSYKVRDTKEASLERNNAKRALRLQLLDHNYDTVRNAALNWIDNKVGTPSIYNVVILGNIDEIIKAISNWNQQLHHFSTIRLKDESKSTPEFSLSNPHVVQATTMLERLKSQYNEQQGLARFTIPVGGILGLLILIPWLIQRRNTKSNYRLFGRKKALATGVLHGVHKSSKRSTSWTLDNDEDEKKKRESHSFKY